MCPCVGMCMEVQVPSRPEIVLGHLQLELHVVVNSPIWFLGIELRSPERAGCILNYCISPASLQVFIIDRNILVICNFIFFKCSGGKIKMF